MSIDLIVKNTNVEAECMYPQTRVDVDTQLRY